MRSTARISSHPIHPMIVALPLGLWIGSWVFDVLGSMRGSSYLWAASFYCAIFGIIGALLAAVPDPSGKRALIGIPGAPPHRVVDSACPFAPRCPQAIDRCNQGNPQLEKLSDSHSVRFIEA